jgi:hypothetical protein
MMDLTILRMENSLTSIGSRSGLMQIWRMNPMEVVRNQVTKDDCIIGLAIFLLMKSMVIPFVKEEVVPGLHLHISMYLYDICLLQCGTPK